VEKLGHLKGVHQVLLTTRRPDGGTANTPVNLAIVDDDTGYFRTWSTSGNARRIQDFPDVRIAPCNVRGRPGGSDQPCRAVPVSGVEATAARRALSKRFPVLQGLLVPLTHRLLSRTTVHYRVVPMDEPTPWMGNPAA
jgi:PPOX class probable F420-dependent enzyme